MRDHQILKPVLHMADILLNKNRGQLYHLLKLHFEILLQLISFIISILKICYFIFKYVENQHFQSSLKIPVQAILLLAGNRMNIPSLFCFLQQSRNHHHMPVEDCRSCIQEWKQYRVIPIQLFFPCLLILQDRNYQAIRQLFLQLQYRNRSDRYNRNAHSVLQAGQESNKGSGRFPFSNKNFGN